ncbi:unnamed protein product [Blepharisma stoltei]|uniref:non-specific serine/threonine protein kinase n=1 Tax=Blepharisma stoltei TaxID=1481888 RepID=A0AAU9IZP4_9CILI|nr:unnamed protein product [Blepharisma stoltei]
MGVGTCCGKHNRDLKRPSRRESTDTMHLAEKLNNRDSKIHIKSDNIQKYYDVEWEIGSGHFGKVKRAFSKDVKISQDFAIKSIPKSKIKGRVELLQRELGSLMVVDHPNIIRLYEVYEDKHYIHLVMELCTGGDLFTQLLEKGRYNEGEAARIIYSILHALSYLHSLHIVHRDLKPENIMFATHDANAEVKLIDFGLAKKFITEDCLLHTPVGTSYYVAPEVLQNNYGPSCDIWSLGVILYMLLTGKPPFNGRSDLTIFKNILSCSYPKEGSSEWESLSEDAHDLLTKMLNSAPQHRITASDALNHRWFEKRNHKDSRVIDKIIFSRLKKQVYTNQLVKESMKLMIKYTKEEDISQLNDIFRELDQEHTGLLTPSELKEGLIKAGISLDMETIENIIRNAAYDEGDKLDYTAFIAATLDRKLLHNKDTLWLAFKQFDIDNTGTISIENLKEVFNRGGKKIRKKELRKILEIYGIDENKGIKFENFCNIFQKNDEDISSLESVYSRRGPEKSVMDSNRV